MSDNFSRILKAGWINFKRNGYLSFGATGVMAITLILFTGLIGLNLVTNQVVFTLQDKIDISAYLANEASEEHILSLKSQVESLSTVETVEYISRDRALELFRERHKEDALIQESLSELEENPLQASLNIKATDSLHYASIASFLETSNYANLIDKVNFYENELVIQRIQSISSGLKQWGLLVTIVLALIAIMVTFNTIRLTIYNQKQEIEIMRLVGASNWQVRGPFLVEGAMYGVLSAIFVITAVYLGLYSASDKIYSFTSVDLFGYFTSFSYQIIPMILIAGVALGIASSLVAIRRYLKV